MLTALFEHQRIETTLQKAMALRPFVEKCIHKAKANTPQSVIFLRKTLKNPKAYHNLFDTIAPRFENLPAGFTRVERIGTRK